MKKFLLFSALLSCGSPIKEKSNDLQPGERYLFSENWKDGANIDTITVISVQRSIDKELETFNYKKVGNDSVFVLNYKYREYFLREIKKVD